MLLPDMLVFTASDGGPLDPKLVMSPAPTKPVPFMSRMANTWHLVRADRDARNAVCQRTDRVHDSLEINATCVAKHADIQSGPCGWCYSGERDRAGQGVGTACSPDAHWSNHSRCRRRAFPVSVKPSHFEIITTAVGETGQNKNVIGVPHWNVYLSVIYKTIIYIVLYSVGRSDCACCRCRIQLRTPTR